MSKWAVIVPAITLGVAAALLFTIKGRWTSWETGRAEQKTDDAYVRADLTPLSTRVSGTVRSVAVDDFQPVRAEQVLVELDDEDYRAMLDQAKAALAAAQAAYDTNQSAKRVQDAQIENAQTGINAATAAVTAAEAGITAVQPDVDRTQAELKREQALLQAKATTHQQFEQAVADADRFAGLLSTRKADLERAKAALSSSKVTLETARQERATLNTKDEIYKADINAKKAAITVAAVNLGYTKIAAPVAGTVGEKQVRPGQLVSPGMQVVTLVQGDVWIQANYKETQLAHVRRGDPADIRIDAHPGVVLHGKVAEVAPASGSQFALLPPDNATGNFTKVVQRLPVKIVLDPGHPLQGELRPGFSAVVTIHVSDRKSASRGAQP